MVGVVAREEAGRPLVTQIANWALASAFFRQKGELGLSGQPKEPSGSYESYGFEKNAVSWHAAVNTSYGRGGGHL